ncbi:MAG: GNAT family N-acetyltransferase [Proteobacteria bacterium]|nr:GNAT family N-acetyltransferase [Pseudomonadota bacterium]
MVDLGQSDLSLRSDCSGDKQFLRMLFATARLDAPLLAQWPVAQRDAFLDQQFAFQDIHYRRYYDGADFLIIEQCGEPVGRLVLDRSTPDWCLVDIALLPEARGKEIGRKLLEGIVASAKAGRVRAISLSVEPGNPAYRLYSRAGFVETESESEASIAMILRLS